MVTRLLFLLENSMDEWACQATVLTVTESWHHGTDWVHWPTLWCVSQWQFNFHSPLFCLVFLVLLLLPWDFGGTFLQSRKHVSCLGCLVSLGRGGYPISAHLLPMSLSRWVLKSLRTERLPVSCCLLHLVLSACMTHLSGMSGQARCLWTKWLSKKPRVDWPCFCPQELLLVSLRRRRVLAHKDSSSYWLGCLLGLGLSHLVPTHLRNSCSKSELPFS